MEIVVFDIQKTWYLRGDKESIYLLLSDVKFSKSDKDQETITLRNLRGVKDGVLSLGNSSFRINFKNIMTKDLLKKYCVVKMIEFYQNYHLCVYHTEKFFIQKAYLSVLMDTINKVILRQVSNIRPFTEYQFENIQNHWLLNVVLIAKIN